MCSSVIEREGIVNNKIEGPKAPDLPLMMEFYRREGGHPVEPSPPSVVGKIIARYAGVPSTPALTAVRFSTELTLIRNKVGG